MKKGDVARMGDSLRVNAGKLSGMAGTVIGVSGERITMVIRGVKDGKAVDVVQTFNARALGRLNNV